MPLLHSHISPPWLEVSVHDPSSVIELSGGVFLSLLVKNKKEEKEEKCCRPYSPKMSKHVFLRRTKMLCCMFFENLFWVWLMVPNCESSSSFVEVPELRNLKLSGFCFTH